MTLSQERILEKTIQGCMDPVEVLKISFVELDTKDTGEDTNTGKNW